MSRTRPTRSRVAAALASALAIVLVATLAACAPRPDRTRDEQPPAAGAPAAQAEAHTLAWGGVEREYLLHLPEDLPDPAPLVVMLHGGFGSDEQAANAYGWNREADRQGFAVVYPNGDGRAWNAGGGCCGAPGNDGTDDVGFLRAVVDEVRAAVPIDGDRIFATGMSNGAMMAYRLACDTDGLFAAVAPVAGTVLGGCPDPHPTSVLHIHGAADSTVRVDGAPGDGAVEIDGAPVADVIAAWRAVDDCAPADETTAGPVTTSTADCPGGRTVELITIADAGHQWPGARSSRLRDEVGGDPPSTALDATATTWDFFERHPLAR